MCMDECTNEMRTLAMQLCVVLRRDFEKDLERRFSSDTSPHSK